MKYLKLIPALLVTAAIIALWYDDFVILLLLVFLFWLFIPIAVAAIYFLVKARRCRNTYEKVTVAWGILNLLLLVGTYVWLCLNNPNAERLAKHYDSHRDDLSRLVQYTRQAIDPGAYIHLEFEHGKASIFHVQAPSDPLVSQHWDDAERNKDSIMAVVGLTPSEYKEIHRLLRQAGCIGITLSSNCDDDSTTVVDWRRDLMGMYSYILFDRPTTPQEDSTFRTDPMFIPYTDRVVLQYSGGAIGRQSFTQEERQHFLPYHPSQSSTQDGNTVSQPTPLPTPTQAK